MGEHDLPQESKSSVPPLWLFVKQASNLLQHPQRLYPQSISNLTYPEFRHPANGFHNPLIYKQYFKFTSKKTIHKNWGSLSKPQKLRMQDSGWSGTWVALHTCHLLHHWSKHCCLVATKCDAWPSHARKVCRNELVGPDWGPVPGGGFFTILCTSSYDGVRGRLSPSWPSDLQLRLLRRGLCCHGPTASSRRRPASVSTSCITIIIIIKKSVERLWQ